MGKDPFTLKEDPGAYFDNFSILPLAYLARNDEEKLKASDDMDEALARRCVIFVLPSDIDLCIDTRAMDDEHANILAQEQINRDLCR